MRSKTHKNHIRSKAYFYFSFLINFKFIVFSLLNEYKKIEWWLYEERKERQKDSFKFLYYIFRIPIGLNCTWWASAKKFYEEKNNRGFIKVANKVTSAILFVFLLRDFFSVDLAKELLRSFEILLACVPTCKSVVQQPPTK